MDFVGFKSAVIKLGAFEKSNIRKKYIEKFVNTESDVYQEQINALRKYRDGYCYQGYLWDCIIGSTIVDEDFIARAVSANEQVYVFWDIHSSERILIKDYWKFEKDDVLQMSMKLLVENEVFLPEDIYIVDKDITWTLIKTHEDIDGKRYCMKSGNI